MKKDEVKAENGKTISLDACGLQCPGPIVKLSSALGKAAEGDIVEISTTDPAFAADIEGFCRRTGNIFLGMESARGISKARIQKCGKISGPCNGTRNRKNIVVFSGDLDKAIASFIIANTAAAMGRKVSMFFTFWGLIYFRRPEKVRVKKDIISRMFGMMMPRGSKKLSSVEDEYGRHGIKNDPRRHEKKECRQSRGYEKQAQANGVELIACSMSMDVMGIKESELIDGVKLSGAAGMLANAEESDMTMFI